MDGIGLTTLFEKSSKSGLVRVTFVVRLESQ